MTRITGTLNQYQHVFMIISCSVLHRMRNVLDESGRENENTHFMFINFLSKHHAIYEIMWKNTVEPGGPQTKI